MKSDGEDDDVENGKLGDFLIRGPRVNQEPFIAAQSEEARWQEANVPYDPVSSRADAEVLA
jgi:hypothetical protein